MTLSVTIPKFVSYNASFKNGPSCPFWWRLAPLCWLGRPPATRRNFFGRHSSMIPLTLLAPYLLFSLYQIEDYLFCRKCSQGQGFLFDSCAMPFSFLLFPRRVRLRSFFNSWSSDGSLGIQAVCFSPVHSLWIAYVGPPETYSLFALSCLSRSGTSLLNLMKHTEAFIFVCSTGPLIYLFLSTRIYFAQHCVLFCE